jgi:hypothetical protein
LFNAKKSHLTHKSDLSIVNTKKYHLSII